MNKLSICQNLFDDWNGAGIQYCHWKGTANICKGVIGETDLDILVNPVDNEQAKKILIKNNFIHFRTQWGLRYPSIQDWIGLDSVTGKLIHIHYHNKMIVGQTGIMEYNFPWERDVLLTRKYDDDLGMYIVSPEYEALTFYTRLGLEYPNKKIRKIDAHHYSFSEEALGEIKYLKDKVDVDTLSKLCQEYYGADASWIVDFYINPQLNKQSLQFLSKLTKRIIPHDGNKTLNKFRSLFVQIVLKYLAPKQQIFFRKKTPISQKGISVVFIGQDGSGKSVVSEKIHKWLSWKIDNRLIYLGFGEQFESWERTLQYKLCKNNDPISRAFRGWLPFKLFAKRARRTKNTLKNANKYIKKGGIAIIDRFPQIQYAGINDGPKIRQILLPKVNNPFLRKIASLYSLSEERDLKKAISFAPDIVFRLQITVDETMHRKPHENKENVIKKHEIVETMNFPHSKIYEIDAAQDFESEIVEIKNIIWGNIPR